MTLLGKTIHYRSAPEGLAVNASERRRLNAFRTGQAKGSTACDLLLKLDGEWGTVTPRKL